MVLKAVHPELQKTILRVSNDSHEHEGISYICRGIVAAFRNTTHHYLSDAYSREDALKICAFIDNLIDIIERAELIKR